MQYQAGCMDPMASNYDPSAYHDNYPCEGCFYTDASCPGNQQLLFQGPPCMGDIEDWEDACDEEIW